MNKGLLLYKTVAIQQLVLIRARVHPFPSQTRKLSSLLPTILGWRRPGKIGSANMERSHSREWLLFLYSYCGSAIHCSKSATIRYNTPITRDRGIFIMEYYMTDERITEYLKALENEERAAATIEKYRRALLSFAAFLSGAAVTPEMIHLWKDDLRASNYAPSTINACLAAVNGFFCFCGWTDCRARFLKIQRRLFRDSRQELTRGEYERLVAAAEAAGDRGLALLMETICSTGIRVSEVQYITVEAAKNGKTEIALKGKIRTILLPSKLCRKLLKYAARQKTASGAIFRTKSGKAMSRYQIWSKMKKLCVRAGVDAGKVFPHNLRHLFATAFYRAYKDIVKLADVLGHSSIETTRIYLVTSAAEHRKQLEQLKLVS